MTRIASSLLRAVVVLIAAGVQLRPATAVAAGCGVPPYPANCAYPCSESTGGPIRILYLGGAAVPPWVGAALTPAVATDDCNGCPLAPSTDYTVQAISWATARTWPEESFRSFDVLLTDSASGSSFSSPSASDPWLPAYTTSRRAVATAVHVDFVTHVSNSNAMRELVQNTVTWLASDECCERPRGTGVVPGIFIAADRGINAMTYTPWRGLVRSSTIGSGSDFQCDTANFDDLINLLPLHEILANTNELTCVTCPGNLACSFDNLGQAAHFVWMPGHSPCGYEVDGFVVVQRAELAAPVLLGTPCANLAHASCLIDASAADSITLVRELPCCGSVAPAPPASCP